MPFHHWLMEGKNSQLKPTMHQSVLGVSPTLIICICVYIYVLYTAFLLLMSNFDYVEGLTIFLRIFRTLAFGGSPIPVTPGQV